MTYIVNRVVIVLGSFVGSKWTFLLLNKNMFDSLFISPEGQRAVNMKSEQTSINPGTGGLSSCPWLPFVCWASLPPPTLMSIVKSSVKYNMKSTMQSTVKCTVMPTVKSFGLKYLNTFREGLLTKYVCLKSEILTHKKNLEKLECHFCSIM